MQNKSLYIKHTKRLEYFSRKSVNFFMIEVHAAIKVRARLKNKKRFDEKSEEYSDKCMKCRIE